MKTKLLFSITAGLLLLVPNLTFGKNIDLGTAADFAVFSSNGSVSNTGLSQVTGNVGTNNGSSTAFGNVNGVMHDQDGASAQAAADLLIAYNQLKVAVPDYFPASLLGNGTTLVAGTYAIEGASTLNLGLILDGKGDPNATFIFQISGSFAANAEAKIILKNGTQACNVFWKIEGQISMAPGVFMRGTVIANNAAILLNTRDTIEGRVLSTTGAISIDGVLIYTPTGCGSPYLTGPKAPDLKSAACFTLFSADGPVLNTGISHILGSVGTNVGLTTGFDSLLVSGAIHPIPDLVTAKCAADLLNAYNYLNVLPYDIELLYPAKFGRNLVLTPHTYILKAAAVFTDSLYLNAEGNADAVFVIKIDGALTTSTYSKVLLINGAQAKNVYWKIEGAVSINNYSVFCGTIVCNNGALGAINTGVTLNGRALTTTGALTSAAITSIMAPICAPTALSTVSVMDAVTIVPNPIGVSTTVVMNVAGTYSLRVFDVLGRVVLSSRLTQQSTSLDTKDLHKGIYFYKVTSEDNIIQSGKLVSNQ
jgi:hypothetical protein